MTLIGLAFGSFRRRFVARPALYTCILLAACAHPSGRVARSIDVRMASDTAELHRRSDGVSFDLLAQLRNNARASLFYFPCGAELQRDIDSEWITVWMPICIDRGSPATLAPRDSTSIVVSGEAFTVPNKLPRLDSRMVPGRYRLVVPLGFRSNGTGITDAVPVEKRASTPFVLR